MRLKTGFKSSAKVCNSHLKQLASFFNDYITLQMLPKCVTLCATIHTHNIGLICQVWVMLAVPAPAPPIAH